MSRKGGRRGGSGRRSRSAKKTVEQRILEQLKDLLARGLIDKAEFVKARERLRRFSLDKFEYRKVVKYYVRGREVSKDEYLKSKKSERSRKVIFRDAAGRFTSEGEYKRYVKLKSYWAAVRILSEQTGLSIGEVRRILKRRDKKIDSFQLYRFGVISLRSPKILRLLPEFIKVGWRVIK